MKRAIDLTLVYRDMWQSVSSDVPTVSQLKDAAAGIIDMGCFDRVETNGGAFEQVCYLSGKNSNNAVREWTSPLRKAGIQTQMLERGLCALRLSPVPADVRELMFKVKKDQGVDIARSFCGLNDHRNLKLSVDYAKKAGMISQVALALTQSPVHSLESYMRVAEKAVEFGCDEICLKDMSGAVSPSFIAQLTSSLKKRYPDIPVHYHGHCGLQDTISSVLEAVKAGADSVDVAVEPLAWGKGHPDVLTVRKVLVENGFLVKDIDIDAYKGLSSMLSGQLSENMSHPGDEDACRLIAESILPGGMVGSMISEMRNLRNLVSMEDVLAEMEYVWPRLGYPPLVTPFSQYVRNVALMNVLDLSKGKSRWKSIDKDSWNMILGRMGRLPGQVCPEIISLAASKGYDFYEGDPGKLYPNELEGIKYMLPEEELLELAMYDRNYRSALLVSERSGAGNDLEPSGEVIDL